MNIKRFTARTSSEALKQVRQELGDDAVVLSTRPGANGVEVLAMASDSMQQIEQAAARTPATRAEPRAAAGDPSRRTGTLAERIAARGERLEPRLDIAPLAAPEVGETPAAGPRADPAVDHDVQALGMSTLTFQDYVRERMLKRRQAEIDRQTPDGAGPATVQSPGQRAPASSSAGGRLADGPATGRRALPLPPAGASSAPMSFAPAKAAAMPALSLRAAPSPGTLEQRAGPAAPFPRRSVQHALPAVAAARPALDDGESTPAPRRLRAAAAAAAAGPTGSDAMLDELRSVRSLIEERFGMLAFMERLQRNPRQVALAQKLFDTGLSPGLVRKLAQGLPADLDDDLAWAAGVLEHNLVTDENEAGLEDHTGVFALIGPTGVGKTTSTAKIAAAFATRHGAAHLGLITLDAYRVAAHEQLRTYGRILGVPVHTAHDRASLEDLLELLSGKKLVLIDTAGMAQRDARTRELLDMLQHPEIGKLLVVNAAAQGETVEDVMVAYGVSGCHGVIVSKLDEAVKLGPALDALIRHRCKVVGVANGQRVPEDWHRLSAQALVQRALRGGGGATWRLEGDEVSLLFAAGQILPAAGVGLHA